MKTGMLKRALAAVLLVAGGALGTYLVMRRPSMVVETGQPAAPAATAPNAAPAGDVTVTLTEEATRRAGIEVATVGTSGASAEVRIPGTVQPNAYRSVTVTPLVGGRVTRVLASLGQQVRRGATLAEVFSPELAEAQTRYLSSKAELAAHVSELRRTEKLVEIGAASRQELEKIHAEHTAATTMVETNEARLRLLGMSAGEISKLSSVSEMGATVRVPAPIDGVVTAREANPGLNVEASTPLFTVVDLSTVWIVGDIYERDFSRVTVGSPVAVTTAAYPNLVLQGTVSYIDPQVKLETRTAQVRVEVPNRGQSLRLGMFVDMQVGESDRRTTTVVPRSAVQVIGNRSVVYLASPGAPGTFTEREVKIGDTSGDQIEILSGVQPGDVVVAKGSFFVRAERERLGVQPAHAGADMPAAVQTARVTVSAQGYQPDRLTLRAGVPARITFLRTSDQTCGTEIAIPSLNIKRTLPLNQPVEIELTPQKTGEIAFACGMNMLRGTIVVQ